MVVSLSDWLVRSAADCDPPIDSRVDISSTGNEVALTVEGLGSVTVSPAGCSISAVNDDSRQQLIALAENWAWGQWLGLNGTYAFHGVTLERDGFGLAILGPPRVGTSLTALALTKSGWRLIADGTCPMRLEVTGLIALAGRAVLEIDQIVTSAFPPATGFEDAGTPRRRSHVPVAATGSSRIDRIVTLATTNIRNDAVVVPGDAEGSKPELRLQENAVAGEALRAANPTLATGLRAFCQAALAVVPLDVALIPAGGPSRIYGPRQVASLIEVQLGFASDSAPAGFAS